MPNIVLKNVTVKYKVKKRQFFDATNNVNVTFPSDKISVIIGQSGCGKTSILRAIIGLTDYSGDISFDDICINDYVIKLKNVAYVSQAIGLYPNMSVFNNIAFPLKAAGCSDTEIRQRVGEISELLHIKSTLARKPKELSLGQAQRVAIARALVKRAMIYLFDEPFSNLDKQISRELVIELKGIFSKLHATVIFVSHDIEEAFAIADRIYVMDNGKIVEENTPRDLLNSKKKETLDLIKEVL